MGSLCRQNRIKNHWARCRKLAEQLIPKLAELQQNCSYADLRKWLKTTVNQSTIAHSNKPAVRKFLRQLVLNTAEFSKFKRNEKWKGRPQRRQEDFFILQNNLRRFSDALLNIPIEPQTKASDVLRILLSSLIVHSGVNSIPMLGAVVSQLYDSSALHLVENIAWLQLEFEHPQRLINSPTGYQHQLFLHPFTLLLWRYWFQSRLFEQCAIPAAEAALDIVHDLALQLGITLPKRKQKILAAAIHAVPDCAGLTELLRNTLNGSYPNACLNHQQFKHLLNPLSNRLAQSLPPRSKRSAEQFFHSQDIRHSYQQLINALKPPAGELKASQSHSLQELKKLAETTPGSLLRDLALWGVEQLSEKSIKISSLLRYYSAFAKSLLNALHGMDWQDFSSESWTEIYQRLLEQPEKNLAVIYRKDRLVSFHNFLIATHSVATVQWPDAKSAPVESVRTGFIDELLFIRLCNLIWRNEPNPSMAQQVVLVCVMAFRLGLRISEVLKIQLRDCSTAEQPTVLIHSNRYGNDKSPNSRRLLPMQLLLDHELDMFLSQLARRRATAAGHSEFLLFHYDGSPTEQLDGNQLASWVSTLLRELAPSTKWTFHHFRHTALSRLMLISHSQLLDKLPAALRANLVPCSSKTSAELSEMLSKNSYENLVTIAGHGAIEMTVKSYMHLAPLMTGLALQNHQADVNPITLQTLTNASGRQISSLKRQFTLSAIPDLLSKKLAREQTSVAVYRPETWLPTISVEDIEICHQALRALESGLNYHDVEHYFLIPESKISKWHQRAQALAELKSRNGNSRIIPLQRAPAFMPAPLHDRADRAIFVQLTERMHQHQLGPKLTEVAKLVLLGSNATHSRVSLKTTVDLNKFLFDFSKMLDQRQLAICDKTGAAYNPENKKMLYVPPFHVSAKFARHGEPDSAVCANHALKLFCFLVAVYYGDPWDFT